MTSIEEVTKISAMVLAELDEAQKEAEKEQSCKRKAVGCSVIELVRVRNLYDRGDCAVIARLLSRTRNGLNPKHLCSSEIGGCGCSHAEQMAILETHEPCPDDVDSSLVVVPADVIHCSTLMICKYSPCTQCANLIVLSGRIDHLIYDIRTDHDMRGLELLRPHITLTEASLLRGLSETSRLLTERKKAFDQVASWVSH